MQYHRSYIFQFDFAEILCCLATQKTFCNLSAKKAHLQFCNISNLPNESNPHHVRLARISRLLTDVGSRDLIWRGVIINVLSTTLLLPFTSQYLSKNYTVINVTKKV